MANLSGNNRGKYVKGMFAHLAKRYDRANYWMSWGQDVKWRHEVIHRAHLPEGARLLDIGTGTGDLALEAIHQHNNLFVVGADFTPEMMQVGRQRERDGPIHWVCNDALDLPFSSCSFDAVVSGYLLRNVSDVQATLNEQYRVLKVGGRMVCLDTTPPPADIWHFPVRWYLRFVVPFIGGWSTGDKKSYSYLYESTTQFLHAPRLAQGMLNAGFQDVGFRCFMGGCMAIHWGIKRSKEQP